MSQQKILIICGPTSSGKTDLALHLAKESQTSIISADSRQVYQGLDVLTGKDIPSGFIRQETSLRFKNRPVIVYEKNNLRLWGFDLLLPDEAYNASDFSSLTQRIIQKEQSEGRLVTVVGGTGFYLKSLTQPETLAKIPPDEKLRQQLNRFSVEELQQKLKEIDPERLNSMNQSDIGNPRRLVRAIEVASKRSIDPAYSRGTTPTTQSVLAEPPYKDGPCRQFVWVGLRLPFPEIKEKIQERVRDRLDAAVSEVHALQATYPNRTLPIYTTLGVKPILRYLAGEIDKEKVRELWTTDEVNYAKRQLTWFNKQPLIIWYDKSSLANIKPGDLL